MGSSSVSPNAISLYTDDSVIGIYKGNGVDFTVLLIIFVFTHVRKQGIQTHREKKERDEKERDERKKERETRERKKEKKIDREREREMTDIIVLY